MVHTCPRCELRFRSNGEVSEHLRSDHGVEAETLDRYRYPTSRDSLPPLYRESTAGDTHRYLVVANQTLGAHLAQQLHELASKQPSSFTVLVPATRPEQYVRQYTFAGSSQPSEAEAQDTTGVAQARWRLRETLQHLEEAGVSATGEVGDAEVLVAIEQLLTRRQFDEIVLSTLPTGLSRWLGIDLPRRIERHFGIPVTTITAPE